MNALRRLKHLLALAAIALAAACSILPGLDPGGDEYWLKGARAGSRVESLLLWFDYASHLPAGDWAREHEQLRQRANADKSDFTRLRLALLLAVPNAPAREQARASSLLEPLTRDAPEREPGLRALARLVAAAVAERRRLGDELTGATQRQREEAARSRDLEQKLEALKAIEQNLQQRERDAASGNRGRR